jgi:hypothetical protein
MSPHFVVNGSVNVPAARKSGRPFEPTVGFSDVEWQIEFDRNGGLKSANAVDRGLVEIGDQRPAAVARPVTRRARRTGQKLELRTTAGDETEEPYEGFLR